MIGKAIHARLKAHSGTYALVGKRIYPLRLPQGPTYPAVRYQVISAPRFHAMGADTGEVASRVQVDCYAETYLAAVGLAAQVLDALSRWEGTAGGVQVQQIFIDTERDIDEPDVKQQGEEGVYRRMIDFIVHYYE